MSFGSDEVTHLLHVASLDRCIHDNENLGLMIHTAYVPVLTSWSNDEKANRSDLSRKCPSVNDTRPLAHSGRFLLDRLLALIPASYRQRNTLDQQRPRGGVFDTELYQHRATRGCF